MLKKLKYSFLDKGSCNCKKAKEKHSDDSHPILKVNNEFIPPI